MTKKQELIKRLNSLGDKEYLKYLIQTAWCVREIVELSMNHDWSDVDIDLELEFIKKENIGNPNSIKLIK